MARFLALSHHVRYLHIICEDYNSRSDYIAKIADSLFLICSRNIRSERFRFSKEA